MRDHPTDPGIHLAVFNVFDFPPDVDQGVTVSVEFCFVLRLGRLKHERTRHRPRHRRRVEPVVWTPETGPEG
jgi:hypothetical protein